MRTSIALGLLLATGAPLQAGQFHTVAYTGTTCTAPADAGACIFRTPNDQRFEATSSRHASFLRLQAGFSADAIFESFGLGGGFIDIVEAEAPYDGWSLAELLNLRELIGSTESDGLSGSEATSEAPSAEDIDKALQDIFDKRADYAAARDRTAQEKAAAVKAASQSVPQAQIDKALADLLAERASWGTSPWDKASERPAVTAADLAVLPTDLDKLLAMREGWGGSPGTSTVKAPLAAGAAFPLPKSVPTETGSVEGKANAEVIINPLEPREDVVLTPVPGRQLDIALEDLLARRAEWAAGSAGADARAVLPTDSLDALLAARATWGAGEAGKPVEAPLAAGAVSPLPKPSASAASPSGADPIVNAPDTKPVAQLEAVPQSRIKSALDSLLAERESWGTSPKTSAAAAQTASEPTESRSTADERYAVLATDSLDALLKQREAWGMGDGSRIIVAPLAAGAQSPLPKSAGAPVAGTTAAEPIVHGPVLDPVAAMTPVPRSQIDAALSTLLETRENWSKETGGASAEVRTAQSGQDAASCQERISAIIGEGTIQFRLGSAAIDDESRALVDRIASVVKGCENVTIVVEGHTDSSGSAAFNLSLSQQRADAVKDALAAAGVAAERLEAKGFGETQPIVANDTAANRAKNRRIAFTVVAR